jgi:hypothetical protein
VSATIGPTAGVDISSLVRKVGSRQLAGLLLEGCKLLPQYLTHRQQRISDPRKMRMALHKLLDPSCELQFRRLADLETKAAQDPAQTVLDVAKLRLHQLACRQYRPRLLGVHRLAMYRPEPTQPHQLRNPASIVAVRLHWHRLERLAHVPRLQQFDRQPRFPHRGKKPLR